MNNSFFNKSKRGVLLLAALSLTACAKNNNSSDVRVAGRGGATALTAPPAYQQGGQNTCSNPTMAVGKIFDPYSSPQFESQVKSFVSATLDPQALGTISGNIADKTGIDFQGTFHFDSQGRLIPTSSTVKIKIVDSFVYDVYNNGQTVQPYIVEFIAADSGVIDRNTRQFEVRFRDNYGEIIFQGRFDNQIAEGTVTYMNNTAVAGYQAASGTLGSFKAYTCALIK